MQTYFRWAYVLLHPPRPHAWMHGRTRRCDGRAVAVCRSAISNYFAISKNGLRVVDRTDPDSPQDAFSVALAAPRRIISE